MSWLKGIMGAGIKGGRSKKRKRGKIRKGEGKKGNRRSHHCHHTSALRRLRQKGCHEFKARLGCMVRISDKPGLI